MRSIHDNNVYAIDIRCEDKEIILRTEFLEKDLPEYTDVIFKNAIAHHFEHIWQGNILLDIEELDPQDFYSDYELELKNARKYGLPISVETADAFKVDVEEGGLKIYGIDPSYGFSGWVICSDIEYLDKEKKNTLA
jgi:hypothetical protein